MELGDQEKSMLDIQRRMDAMKQIEMGNGIDEIDEVGSSEHPHETESAHQTEQTPHQPFKIVLAPKYSTTKIEMAKEDDEHQQGENEPQKQKQDLPNIQPQSQIAENKAVVQPDTSNTEESAIGPPTKKRKTLQALEEIMQLQEQMKEQRKRKDNWICENIVVKVMSKDLADGKYFKKKGVIKKVFDKYLALVRLNESGDVLKIDQSELETVIPQHGGHVRIVNGAYRGELATLVSLIEETCSAIVKIETGKYLGNSVELLYDDICKTID